MCSRTSGNAIRITRKVHRARVTPPTSTLTSSGRSILSTRALPRPSTAIPASITSIRIASAMLNAAIKTIPSPRACQGREFFRRIPKYRQIPRSQPMEPCRAISDLNSLSNAQCGDQNDPLPACVPGPGILPADSQVQANPALATYGTLPRNYFRGPGYINIDMAFSKTTAITERVKLEIRAEFFNIFNHANFTNPGVINNGVANGNTNPFSGGSGGINPNSGVFGQITSTYDPRIIQLAGRFSF